MRVTDEGVKCLGSISLSRATWEDNNKCPSVSTKIKHSSAVQTEMGYIVTTSRQISWFLLVAWLEWVVSIEHVASHCAGGGADGGAQEIWRLKTCVSVR